MYYGSEEFNNAIENTQGNALKTRLKFSDEEIIELVSSMRYYGGSNDSDDLMVGNTVSAYVDVSAFTDKLLTGREFLLESGVKLSDGTYEYAPIGYFTVQTPNGDYDEVSFTAYDRMIKFEKVYNSSLTYPTNSAAVLNEICTMCGVTLATPITNPITITENLKGYTCREVLGYIAGIHGFFACIDRFGELNLHWYSDTPIEKSLRMVWSFEKSQEEYEVERVEVAKDSETAFTSGDGVVTLYHSNPYATQDIANSLYGELGGYSYTPAEVEMLDDIRLDPWDVLSVTYYDDIAYKIPCMSIIHDFGDSSTTIKSVGKTSSENEYKFTGPTIKYLNRMATDLLVANRVLATKVDAGYVQAHAITTDNLDAITAQIKTLVVDEIDGLYADIHLANIDIADIGQFYAKSGILDDIQVSEGVVTGTLKGVRILGDLIEANTIKADSLILSGSEESLIYQINVNSSGLSAEQLSEEVYKQKLSGTDLVAKSVTANELAVGSVTAEKILAKSITVDKLDITSLSAITADLGTVTAGVIQSEGYDPDIGTGMEINLANGSIWSQAEDFEIIFSSEGELEAYSSTGNSINWVRGADIIMGQASCELVNGYLKLNNVVYKSSGVNVGGMDILNWTTEGIIAPKISSKLIYCDGPIVANEITGSVVKTPNGTSLQTVANSVNSIQGDYVSKTAEDNTMSQDYVCHSFANDGTARFIKFARLKVNSANVNATILMNIAGRARTGTLTLTFKSASTAEATTIAGISQEGSLERIYYVPVGSGVFDLYMYCSAWAHNTITSIELSQYARNYVTLTWQSSTASSLPTGSVAASRYFNRSSDAGYFSKASVGGYDNTANYALTASSFQCNSWVRSVGDTGWYNDSHGGGFQMYDNTWIRTYGNKGFSCNQTIRGKAVTTEAGANLDKLDTILKQFYFGSGLTVPAKKLSFFNVCYYNNTADYGFTIRWGSAGIGAAGDDTYYIAVRYDGLLAIGYQLNGATNPTWAVK